MPRFRIAVITTAYFKLAHADVIVTRWLAPLPTDLRWGWPASGQEPRSSIASLYIAPSEPRAPGTRQRDIGREIAARHGVPVFENIRDALTLGGETLAVDGILLIGEHGDYPLNELGQKLYPRFEFWEEIVRVMRESGRRVPVFVDKHFSYENSKAIQMVETARQLGIPLMAGSSLSHCELLPPLEVAPRAPLRDAVTLFYGGEEAYGFHILEVAQTLFERRRGGESGISGIRVLKGAEARDCLAGRDQLELLEAALRVPGQDDYGEGGQQFRALDVATALQSATAYCVEHADGFRAAHLHLHGHWPEFVVALRDEAGTIRASRVDGGDAGNFFAHFATLNRKIEDMFLDGSISAPLERTLLATLTINSLMAAAQHPGRYHDTPHLLLPYEVEGLK